MPKLANVQCSGEKPRTVPFVLEALILLLEHPALRHSLHAASTIDTAVASGSSNMLTDELCTPPPTIYQAYTMSCLVTGTSVVSFMHNEKKGDVRKCSWIGLAIVSARACTGSCLNLFVYVLQVQDPKRLAMQAHRVL